MIGVDGGGTHTVAVASRKDGTIIATSRGQGINYHNIGMDCARRNLHQVVTSLMARCDNQGYDVLSIGMSALDEAADKGTVQAFAGDMFDAGKIDMQSDAYTALMGFTLGKPGMIVICGTGSILLMLDEHGRQHVRGGWGHILGDTCSSYTLAVEGLRAVIDYWEGRGEYTALIQAATDYFGISCPRDLINHVYNPGASTDQLAQFARIVLQHNTAGDAVAQGIVARNVMFMAKEAAAMIAQCPKANRVGLYGGVFYHNPDVRVLFENSLRPLCPAAQVDSLSYPPELGALIHCFLKQGTLNDDVLQNLQKSYMQMRGTCA